jgi:hypothetical protein
MVTITEVEAKVDTHIDVCAVRYEGIALEMRSVNARLKRIEQILISVSGALILFLAGLVVTVIQL